MEDAHLILLAKDYGVFGVFDGHGACSEFAARRQGEIPSEVTRTLRSVKDRFFKIDQEFLDSEQASGSTATMCVVKKPKAPGAKHQLLVINAGDSRVLLGKRDGSIVDGGGTDKGPRPSGLTTDHKPDNPKERARIERCGGKVEIAEGGVSEGSFPNAEVVKLVASMSLADAVMKRYDVLQEELKAPGKTSSMVNKQMLTDSEITTF
eukprot:Skav205694  [mRNA]  locus=scaffold2655:192893:196827:- [translate_table: standard]